MTFRESFAALQCRSVPLRGIGWTWSSNCWPGVPRLRLFFRCALANTIEAVKKDRKRSQIPLKRQKFAGSQPANLHMRLGLRRTEFFQDFYREVVLTLLQCCERCCNTITEHYRPSPQRPSGLTSLILVWCRLGWLGRGTFTQSELADRIPKRLKHYSFATGYETSSQISID